MAGEARVSVWAVRGAVAPRREVARIVPVGLGKLESSLDAHDGDARLVRQARLRRWPVDPAPVEETSRMVQTIFDAPVPAHERVELGGGLFGGKRGQAVYGLMLDLAGLDVSKMRNATVRRGALSGWSVRSSTRQLRFSMRPCPLFAVRCCAHLGALPVEPGESDEQRSSRSARPLLEHAPRAGCTCIASTITTRPLRSSPRVKVTAGISLLLCATASCPSTPQMLHGCRGGLAGGVVAGGAADRLPSMDRLVAAVLPRPKCARRGPAHRGRARPVEERVVVGAVKRPRRWL